MATADRRGPLTPLAIEVEESNWGFHDRVDLIRDLSNGNQFHLHGFWFVNTVAQKVDQQPEEKKIRQDSVHRKNSSMPLQRDNPAPASTAQLYIPPSHTSLIQQTPRKEFRRLSTSKVPATKPIVSHRLSLPLGGTSRTPLFRHSPEN